MNFTTMSNKAVLEDLGIRVQRERLNQDITQVALAERAGVARKVVQQVEYGRGCTLESLIRVLRSLGKLDQLDTFLPETGLSPVQLAKLKGHQRQRATSRHRRRTPEAR